MNDDDVGRYSQGDIHRGVTPAIVSSSFPLLQRYAAYYMITTLEQLPAETDSAHTLNPGADGWEAVLRGWRRPPL